jgi:hypothetical protein
MGPIDMSQDENKNCPRCAETVKVAALVCRFCGHEFDGASDVPLYDFNNIRITRHRFWAAGREYPIQHISAFRGVIIPPKTGFGVFLILVASVLFVLALIATINAPPAHRNDLGMLFWLCFALFFWGIWSVSGSKDKAGFMIHVMIDGQEREAVLVKRQADAEAIMTALSTATQRTRT